MGKNGAHNYEVLHAPFSLIAASLKSIYLLSWQVPGVQAICHGEYVLGTFTGTSCTA